jgi:PAS domain S-box-containing protein
MTATSGDSQSGSGIRRWIIAAFASLALAGVAGAVAVYAVRSGNERFEADRWERHSFQVQLTAQKLKTALDDAETGQRGFLLVGEEPYLEPYKTGRVRVMAELAELKALTQDNPAQQVQVARLADIAGRRMAILDSAIAHYRAGDTVSAVNVIREGAGKRAMDEARAILARIETLEGHLLAERTQAVARANARSQAAILALAALGAVLLAFAAAAGVYALRSLDRVRAGERLKAAAEDLAKAHAFLQLVIDKSIDPIFVKDREARFVVANDRAGDLYGVPKEALLGRRAVEFLPAPVAEVLEAADREVMSTGQPKIVEERFLERGETRVYQISKTPWQDDGEGVAGIIVVAHDVTERKADEERLRHQSEILEHRVQERTREIEAASAQVRQLQKMEAVGQLTGGIAHDFNNMLAIVIGSLDIAGRRLETDPDKARAFINNALEGARRAATLTARLLAFARQTPLEPEPVDPNKLVGGMSEMLRRTIGEALKVETVLAGGIWRIFADAGQLENALLNLCVNARDAMPDGGHLTIETSNAHLDDAYAAAHSEVVAGQYALIAVTDTGAGMPPEVIERAFDPFYTTKGVGRGTGLGLSQVYGFVKQSGGHVKIYSEPGQGTTVKLYLPRFTGRSVAKTEEAIKEPRPLGATAEVILVVEDEPAVRHMSVDALRELGYTVVQAENAAQALQQLELQPSISLLFTDIVMPDMNGRRLADEAVARRPGLKVLYTTGYSQNAVIHNGTLDYGVAFLPKPFSLDSLARKVRQVLDNKGANRVAGA